MESNLRTPDHNGDEPLGEMDSLDLSWADAVSPSGTKQIFRSTAGESFVLDEYGGLVVKVTDPIAWTIVNDLGVAAGIKTLHAPVLHGEPAQMLKRLLFSTEEEFERSLPPGSSVSPTLISLSNDGKALIHTSLINSQLSSSPAYFLFDTATSTLARVRQPGLGNESIVNLSLTNGRLLGNGPKLFQEIRCLIIN